MPSYPNRKAIPSFPNRRVVLKGIVKYRQKNMGNTNQTKKLRDLYEAKIELLKEQVIKARNLEKRRATNLARKEKLKLAREEYALQLKEMEKLLKDLNR